MQKKVYVLAGLCLAVLLVLGGYRAGMARTGTPEIPLAAEYGECDHDHDDDFDDPHHDCGGACG